jgi:hypothetical protein
MANQKTYGYILLVILFIISIFKDDLTPDYLNTPSAFFMNPENIGYVSALISHQHYPLFWVKAYCYSLLFIAIPSAISFFLFPRPLFFITVGLLAGVCVIEYGILFSGYAPAIVHVLPKLNRYFHSPLITLFLLAAFTLYQQYDNNSN